MAIKPARLRSRVTLGTSTYPMTVSETAKSRSRNATGTNTTARSQRTSKALFIHPTIVVPARNWTDVFLTVANLEACKYLLYDTVLR